MYTYIHFDVKLLIKNVTNIFIFHLSTFLLHILNNWIIYFFYYFFIFKYQTHKFVKFVGFFIIFKTIIKINNYIIKFLTKI